MNGAKARILFLTVFAVAPLFLFAQQQEKGPDNEPVRGGVTYDPIRGEDDKLRDPFKSPFELAQEAEEAADENPMGDEEERLPFDIAELSLKGIYLAANTGYWAIFSVGDEYKWFQVGVKFRDGDLVNITDGAVVFNHFVSDGGTQVREVVKELRRGEE